jgi:hypothetical protein
MRLVEQLVFLQTDGSCSAVADSKRRMRKRAVHALLTHTNHAIRDLRNDEDEMLRGRDPTTVSLLPLLLY